MSIPDTGNDVLNLSGNKEFTISFWHKPYDNESAQPQQVFTKATPPSWTVNLMYSWIHVSSSMGRATVINNSASYKDVLPAPAQKTSMLNNWNFITLTMNRSISEGTFSYYHNGVLKGKVTDPSLVTSHPNINGVFTLGAWKYPPSYNVRYGQFYNGELDEFRVYDYSMRADEVNALYRSYS